VPSNGKETILMAKSFRETEKNALDAESLLYDSDLLTIFVDIKSLQIIIL